MAEKLISALTDGIACTTADEAAYAASALAGERLRIRGKVQGVGFRPWIWQLAQQLSLKGDVCNDGGGVEIRLAGDAGRLIACLHQHCPPLAQIDSVERQPMRWRVLPEDFTIRQSGGGTINTRIAPDAATCADCLAELMNPADRRYQYAFLNCTHCGPRFTIINALPYDRPATVMAAFPLCAACAAEYQNPADRRFHAQPVACPACGPQLYWQTATASAVAQPALLAAVRALLQGQIVAIKAIGGFHLACDASNAQAIIRLRQRKRRPDKPLAVMIADSGNLPAEIATLLSSAAAPIVLVKKALFPLHQQELLAPALSEIGLMLPSTPLAHLLMQAVKRPLVMTSANAAGHAPALSNEQALTDLADIADGWLLHNRDIVQRMDDSLLRPGVILRADPAVQAITENGLRNTANAGELYQGAGYQVSDRQAPVQQVSVQQHSAQRITTSHEILRRARGYVPDVLPLPPGLSDMPPILATGADLKNTFCLLRGDSAMLSQHFGDLTQPDVVRQWQQTLEKLCRLWQFQPRWVVNDAHPGYQSALLGRQLGLAELPVLHHHAHAAACLAEHGYPLHAPPVIALTLDGIGFGGYQPDSGDNAANQPSASQSAKPFDEDKLIRYQWRSPHNGSNFTGNDFIDNAFTSNAATHNPSARQPQWWGGECLLLDYRHCQHLGGLPAVALAGGDLAARQPWRNLLAHCLAFVPHWQQYPETCQLRKQPWQPLAQAIKRKINSPLASSAGRLFDAVAAALGMMPAEQSYEGQAACWLEMLASQCDNPQHPVSLPLHEGQMDLAMFWQQWLNWRQAPSRRAFAFHDALAAGLAALARFHASKRGIDTIVCSGGVLHNSLLRQRLAYWLADFTLLFPCQLPAGDGAIAYGQAVIAAACWQAEHHQRKDHFHHHSDNYLKITEGQLCKAIR